MLHTEYMRLWRKKNKVKNAIKNREAQKRWVSKLTPAQRTKRNRKRYLQDRLKVLVRSKLRYEVRMGRIKRQSCVICGSKNAHGHHTDYRKPLQVTWLCKKHHDEEHHSK